ncbi:MAG: energy-coupling factor ABC transporter ATP-binding protein [Clostridiales Family XIII bacterium]|jgi:cobalt/nickel transport system ATP-binding protein|nr:energy-coupling factor ABC transporter ATP-binding protein [Clostridiales Family XIII bacterium]
MLVVRDLCVSYPDRENAVDGLSFEMGQGESVALVGANGAGKTTLLFALAGALEPSRGEISLDGAPLGGKAADAARRKIGLVFQNPDDQLFMPSIYEDVAFGPRNLGCTEGETRELAEGALSRLGISHLAQRSPLRLSGGEKRLAAIAAVLAMRPDYILMDEPTAFLDPRAKRALAALLSGLPQGRLIATHDLAFAERNCSRVLLLKDGRLAADGGAGMLGDAPLLESAGLF